MTSGAHPEKTLRDARDDVVVTLTPRQAGWLTGLARARVNKARRRVANVLEAEGQSWHHEQLSGSPAAMEDALELLEAVMEDVDEDAARWTPESRPQAAATDEPGAETSA